jgi:hypothetical protein
MTAEPCSQPAGEDAGDAERMLELLVELDLWGIVTDDPGEGTSARVLDLPGGWCEINLRGSRELAVTYLPLGRDLRPHEAIWLALAVLDGNGPPAPGAAVVPDPGLAPAEAVSRVLGSCGMAAEQGEIGDGGGEVIAALFAANPADQSRGRLTIRGGNELTWECRFAGPGGPVPGLSPACIAGAIAAALAGVAGEAR